MGQKEFIPNEHVKARSFFRLLGPVFLFIGVVCMIVAFIDFFTLEGFEEPEYFWLFFVSIPVLFIGFVFSNLGYGSKVAKYQSREYAPVVKDTFNYLAKETTSGVKEISQAIKQGSDSNLVTCQSCNHQNPSDAKFCNHCSAKLVVVCSKCEHKNRNGARFCNDCGSSLQ